MNAQWKDEAGVRHIRLPKDHPAAMETAREALIADLDSDVLARSIWGNPQHVPHMDTVDTIAYRQGWVIFPATEEAVRQARALRESKKTNPNG